MADVKRKVVCVEDDPEIIELIKFILDRKGFEFVGVLGGQEGLETMRRVKPDLVLLDLMMPEMDGWEVYKRMKADKALCNIPVIVVTADGQPITRVLGLHIAKVDDFITKPFGPQDLVKSIEKVLSAKPE
jgi:two-component system response regulator VicR